jgi:hypothetical protein
MFPSVSHVQIAGMPLSGEFQVGSRGNDALLVYFPDARKRRVRRSE